MRCNIRGSTRDTTASRSSSRSPPPTWRERENRATEESLDHKRAAENEDSVLGGAIVGAGNAQERRLDRREYEPHQRIVDAAVPGTAAVGIADGHGSRCSKDLRAVPRRGRRRAR